LTITNRYYRIFSIVWLASRFFIQIIWHQHFSNRGQSQHAKQRWQQLLAKQAKEYKQFALKFQGVTIKFGQFMSVRADVLPRQFLDELSDLIDRVPPTPRQQSMDLLQSEWNSNPLKVLAQLDSEPIASASIADVYRAHLHDGCAVAVKIQRPHIEKIINADIKALQIIVFLVKRLTNWGNLTNLDVLQREFAQIITNELDFRLEYKHATTFAANFQHINHVRVPAYFPEWTTRKVIVSEWVEGASITNIPFIEQHQLNPSDIASLLMGSFIQQIAKHGFFHADPHPGNILIEQDGTLVFIDFGMVGTIPQGASQLVVELVQSIIFKNYAKAVDSLYKLKFIKNKDNQEALERILESMMGMYINRTWSELDLATMDHLMNDFREFVHQQPIQLPAEYAFLGRAISLISGILSVLDPDLDVIEIAKPHVMDVLSSNSEDEQSTKDKLPSLSIWLRPLMDALQSTVQIPTLVTELLKNEIEQQKKQEKLETIQILLKYLERKQQYWLISTGGVVIGVGSIYFITFDARFFLLMVIGLLMGWKVLAIGRDITRIVEPMLSEIRDYRRRNS
jgi:predicted unusual protein kinase regulating ubiquinone biosynthesis (AarF/ABC1/UbiB family)